MFQVTFASLAALAAALWSAGPPETDAAPAPLDVNAPPAAKGSAAGAPDICLGPDGLAGPCWEPTFAELPDFPAFTSQGLGICRQFCDPETNCVLVTLDVPQQVQCGVYLAPIRVDDCGGITLLKGEARLDYTRTWDELSPLTEYQVYRFAVKVDLVGEFNVTPFCPVPSCLNPPPLGYFEAFFYGYVDWAFNCSTGEWHNALTLFHNCDHFIHQPPLSDHPGAFHPETSYAIVAPSTPANPFTPAFTPHPGGPLVAEAVRNVSSPAAPGLCLFEEKIAEGQLLPFIPFCACPLSTTPPLNNEFSFFRGVGTCTPLPSDFEALLDLFPLVPWLGLLSTSIGCWSSPLDYPGPECVNVDEGLFRYFDGCLTTPGGDQGVTFAEVFYGAATTEGHEVLQEKDPLTRNFVDLAGNWSFALPGAAAPPIFGSVLPTEHLIYVNTP